jgi:hypothetical protein
MPPTTGQERAYETWNMNIMVGLANPDVGKLALGIPFQGRIPYFSVPSLTVELRRGGANLESRTRPIRGLAIPR